MYLKLKYLILNDSVNRNKKKKKKYINKTPILKANYLKNYKAKFDYSLIRNIDTKEKMEKLCEEYVNFSNQNEYLLGTYLSTGIYIASDFDFYNFNMQIKAYLK
jgi:hypothetical protein